MTSPLQCTQCQAPLGEEHLNRGGLTACPGCGSALEVEVFPALFRPASRGAAGEPVLVEGEASCFYHPEKKAAVPCQACGRFLCGLCDCELQGKHFCPGCLETGREKGKMQNLQNQRTLYGNIALALAVWPVVLVFGVYFTIFTAPMALYVAIRYWNAPLSLVGRTRARHVIAIVLGTLQIVGWGVGIYFIVKAANG